MRKFATRMAIRPIASSPIRKGSRLPETFTVINGPMMAPMTMMALFATTTFWNVVRLRCHHRGSSGRLTR